MRRTAHARASSDSSSAETTNSSPPQRARKRARRADPTTGRWRETRDSNGHAVVCLCSDDEELPRATNQNTDDHHSGSSDSDDEEFEIVVRPPHQRSEPTAVPIKSEITATATNPHGQRPQPVVYSVDSDSDSEEEEEEEEEEMVALETPSTTQTATTQDGDQEEDEDDEEMEEDVASASSQIATTHHEEKATEKGNGRADMALPERPQCRATTEDDETMSAEDEMEDKREVETMEVEDSSDLEEEQEEDEEEWKPEVDAGDDETHESNDEEEDEEEEEEEEEVEMEEAEDEEEEEEEEEEEDVMLIERAPRRQSPPANGSSGGNTSVQVKKESESMVVKTEPGSVPAPVSISVKVPVRATPAPAPAPTPAPAADSLCIAPTTSTSASVKPEPENGHATDDGDSDAVVLLPFSQHDHEAPPARTRPPPHTSQSSSLARPYRPHRHPRAARRSNVRRRRLDDDHAGMLLFEGKQDMPTSSEVAMLIEFIARCVGPVTSDTLHWIEYLLQSKLNTAIDRQADDVMTRYSEWMKIALGVSDEASRARNQVQREPLLPLPIRYTIRPVQIIAPAAPSNGKAKAKRSSTPDKKRRSMDLKSLEKSAAAIQAGDKRIKSEHAPTRRRVAVAVPPSSSGPFSPTSSTTSSVSVTSSRGARDRASSSRELEFSSPHRERKQHQRGRVPSSPHSKNLFFSPPSSSSTAASPSSRAAPLAFFNLAADEDTSGTNRSMPKDWNVQDARTCPTPLRPVAMNPLFTMSLRELKAHIRSVQLDGRAKNVEKPLEIVHKLMTHPRNRFGTFNVPVDPVLLNLPTYHDIIKNPMDLGTIKLRLEEGVYLEQDDFVADVELVFENAMTFNPPRHSVHVDASFLLRLFDELQQGSAHDRLVKRRKQQQQTERHACRVCFGNTCVMCEQGCQPFAQPHLQCAGSCGTDIRKGMAYYITRDGTRVWCAKCRLSHVRTPSDLLQQQQQHAMSSSDAHVDEATHNGGRTKSKTKKKKKRDSGAGAGGGAAGSKVLQTIELPNELVAKKVELDAEPWVKCVRCCRWLHQVCGLYNPVYGAYAAEHEYVCPLCVWKQRSPPSVPRGMASLLNEENASPPQDHESSCHQIPKCAISTFIEDFLRNGLRDMKHLQAAEELHVRVLSFPHERVFVPEGVVKTFHENANVLERLYATSNYQNTHRFPSEIPFTSRGIFLFQRHEGTDVCLFTLFVQEFGDTCALEANRRSVYVAYLDSIRYLKPPEARTASYHLIMMAYFDYIRRHGFERVHIWSCPPQKRISYVFWCRPPFQKTPSADHLRKWYGHLLTKSQNAGIVKSWTNMYDRYFTARDYSSLPVGASDVEMHGTGSGTGSGIGTSTRGTASRSVDPKDHAWPTTQLPPIFDGDFLPAELERILGYLSSKNDKYRRGSRGGKSTAVGTSGGKVAVGEFVARIKEEHTAESSSSSSSASSSSAYAAAAQASAQVEFKLRDVFQSCQSAIQRLKNDLLVVDLVVPELTRHAVARCTPHTNVPAWWHQVPRFFGSRFMFHQLCATASYQFDSLRRAKHSTMMMLHHFFNERVPQLNVFCSVCCLLISHADYWHCPSCERFALCDMCHHREGGSHMHALEFGGRRRRMPLVAAAAGAVANSSSGASTAAASFREN